MFQCRRTKRINRALGAVLQTIDDDHERLRKSTATWTQIDWLSIAMDRQRCLAYDRAKALHDRWQARVAADAD